MTQGAFECLGRALKRLLEAAQLRKVAEGPAKV